ncbi:unnamed protein product [Dibothriocephalus latus]|uniref:Myb/SANT-like DNA-binding domain-containing protein n=1 Tax=Dibothriocephalus latus TaxID=60516 RepID=A0A3P7NSB0_DIBLA|nr:unnamed protein product [Dibothriocephalus latus]
MVEMASIISPMTKRRAESFVLEEIRVMLQEIERRKHILLSVSPASNKLKRRAWEEVANCMALRWPQETRRTGDQPFEQQVIKRLQFPPVGKIPPTFVIPPTPNDKAAIIGSVSTVAAASE